MFNRMVIALALAIFGAGAQGAGAEPALGQNSVVASPGAKAAPAPHASHVQSRSVRVGTTGVNGAATGTYASQAYRGGGYQGALTHDVIHGLDITVALGLGRRVPPERLAIVLDGISAARSVRFFGGDLGGVQLRADDLDWSFGSGEPVSGSAQDLALVVCGRKVPPGHLRGGPSARFTGVAGREAGNT